MLEISSLSQPSNARISSLLHTSNTRKQLLATPLKCQIAPSFPLKYQKKASGYTPQMPEISSWLHPSNARNSFWLHPSKASISFWLHPSNGRNQLIATTFKCQKQLLATPLKCQIAPGYTPQI
jgi:hypothetical protein